MVPGVSTVRYLAAGDWGEAALSLAGDAALFVGGPLAAFAKSRGAVQTARGLAMTAIGLEGAVGTMLRSSGRLLNL